MTLQDFTTLAWITTEMMITSIDKKDQTFIVVDRENEYLIDMNVGAFELYVKSQRLLEKETIEKHFMYEWPVTIVEPISFTRWLEETPEEEVARHLSNYYLAIGHKNMTHELEVAIKTTKLSEL